MIAVGVLGASGRMGRQVTQLLAGTYSEQARLVAAPTRGGDLGELLSAEIVIDFSSPEAVIELVKAATRDSRSLLPALVVGSTGWTDAQRAQLEPYALRSAVLQSANFSLGVLAMLKIVRESAPLLRRLGYEPVLTETHHVHKKDAPSGTALAIERAVRADGSPAFPVHAIRAGEIIGIHELGFYGAADHLIFKHDAQDRSLFARGAIETAVWLANERRTGARPKGWVSTDDFLTHKGARA